MTQSHTVASLADDLARLGVEEGDVLFAHSSFKSLGAVEGGAETVVRALERAVGPEGTILMPSFNLVKENREGTWDPATSPSTVGWLTEFFRRMPGTLRSDHYSHAVAARGRRAEWFVKDHLSRRGWKSPWDRGRWGHTFGQDSPMLRACDADGKILMIGVDYNSSTYMHVLEVRHWNEDLAANPDAEYFWINRQALGEHWDSLGQLQRGKVGDADCRLFSIRCFLDTCSRVLRERPADFFKYWHE